MLTAGLRRRALGAVVVAAGALLIGQPASPPVRALVGVAIAAGAGLLLAPPLTPRRLTTTAGVVSVALVLGLTFWIGSNSARVGWFGGLTWHGPRGRPEVALTFDDGPSAVSTLAVRDVLDRYGVKGTFFTVGKALDARPDISRALLADGHLLGNHSYVHDYLRWLAPGYPELDRTQQAFARDLGVCPTFFRPPHGQHTPLMARVVHGRRMAMVTWDVSAGDWATTDGALVARRVLAKVRPGSIILLHDGLDGNVSADRSVLLTALPLILEGLKARGLQPVRLDQLLGKPAYAGKCGGGAPAALPTPLAG